MEQLFDLQQVPTLQKVTITSLFLKLDQFSGPNGYVITKIIVLSLGPFLQIN